MPSELTLKAVGNWNLTALVPLREALTVSQDVFGRSAPEACKHAVILMAQSAAAATPKSRKTRPVLRNIMGPYVQTWTQVPGDRGPHDLYKFKFMPGNMMKRQELTGDWEKAKRIKNAGLGKRSWMWQLGRGSAIPGTSYVALFNAGKYHVGYVKQNKLGYILDIMQAGWKEMIAQKAVNKIMAQAGKKIGAAFHRALQKAA